MLHYTPAPDGWLTAVRPGLAVMVAPGSIEAAELWRALAGGFEATITLLASSGFATMPSFAVVEHIADGEGAVRVIVRGAVTARVTTSEGERLLDGTGVSTWTETTFSGASGWAIEATDSAASPTYPLERGAVLAARVATSSATLGTDAEHSQTNLDSASVSDDAVDADSSQGSVAVSRDRAPLTENAARPAAKRDERASEATLIGMPSEGDFGSSDPEAEAESEADGDDYDFLFGETRHIDVSEARAEARRAREEDGDATDGSDASGSEGDSEPASPMGDHDGMTLVSHDIRALRARRKAQGASEHPAGEGPVEEARFVIEVSTGGSEELSQPLLFGRAPTAAKVSGDSLPRLVTIPGDKDISRNHVQVTLEGGTVVVTDLHSRNGTQVVLPGRSPQQLRAGEPTSVIDGTVIDLGGVTLTVREVG